MVDGQQAAGGRSFEAAGIAITSVLMGAGLGGALLCIVLAAAHGMERGPETTFSRIAIGALAASLTTAAASGAFLARALGVWRAAIAAMIALAGAALVGVLTTAADIAGGVAGLLLLAALCLGVTFGAWRLRPASAP